MKEGMSQAAAEAKHFDEILQDIDINQDNINDLWGEAGEVLDAVASGELDAAEASETLGESFSTLLESAQDFGTEGSAAMVDFIQQVKASGVEVQEVTDYINDQLGVVEGNSMNAAEGLAAMAEGVGNNEEAMVRLETQTLAVYNAMIENGASASQAMDSLGDVLDKIAEKHKENGTQASAAIQELLKVREVTEAHQGLMNSIEGNLAVLNALGNTGSLNQETLSNAAKEANNYYNQLVNAGLSGNQALSQMAPTLERLRYLSEEQGLSLDANTQKLIKQAEEQGLLEEQQMETNDIMLAGFGEIIKALGGDIPAAMQKAMNEMQEFGQESQDTMDGIAVSGKNAFGEVRDRAREASDEFVRDWEERSKTAFGGMLSAGSKAIDSIRGKISDAGGEFKDSFDRGVDGALGAIDKLGKKIQGTGFGANIDIGVSSALSKGAQAISAQSEGSWYVKAQEQLFQAHKGERVDIYHTPVSDVPSQAGVGSIQVVTKPVVVQTDKGVEVSFVIDQVNRLEKKIIKGGVPIPTSSVRGTA